MPLLATAKYRQLIDAVAAFHGVPTWMGQGGTVLSGQLLEGIVLAESGGDPLARRYEPHQDRAGRTDAASDGDRAGVDDALLEDDASYGLMQILGLNYRKFIKAAPGTALNFSVLFRPVLNLDVGCWVLTSEIWRVSEAVAKNLIPRGTDIVAVALARYNGGPYGNPWDDGKLRNQGYVDRIREHALRVQRGRM